MNELKTYSPDRIKIIVGGTSITGYADGTFVTIEAMTDGVTSVAGADGEVARSMSLDPRHTITVTLLQTSRGNTVLSNLADADRISGGDRAVPISVTDLRGQTLFSGTGWVVKKANAAYGKEVEGREWQLQAVGEFTSGGND